MRRGGTGRGMGRGTRGGVGGGAGCGDAAVIPSLLVDNQLMLLVETRNSTTNSVLHSMINSICIHIAADIWYMYIAECKVTRSAIFLLIGDFFLHTACYSHTKYTHTTVYTCTIVHIYIYMYMHEVVVYIPV